jgi:hypothetical protein
MLKKKFELGREYYKNSSYTFSIGSDETSKKMNECVILLDRLLEDQYHENAFVNYDKKWGEMEMKFGDVVSNKGRAVTIVRKNVTPETVKQKWKESKRLSEHSDKMRRNDLERFCHLLNRNLFKFWA